MYNIGVIGLGIMGQRMLNAIDQYAELTVTHAWDIDAAACEATQSRYDYIKIRDNAAEVINQPTVDLIYIASPPKTHVPYAEMAVAAGKAILCEKPLAVNLADSRKLTQLAAQAGVSTAVNFPFASSTAVSTLQTRLQNAEQGQTVRVEMRFHFITWPRAWQQGAAAWLAGRDEGGFVREVVSHFIYLTHKLVGPAKVRRAKAVYPADPNASEVWIDAELEAAGVPVYISGGVGGSAPDYNEWTFYGSDHSYSMIDWGLLKEADGSGRWQSMSPDKERQPAMGDQLDQIVNMLANRPHTLPDFAAGLAVQEIVEQLLS